MISFALKVLLTIAFTAFYSSACCIAMVNFTLENGHSSEIQFSHDSGFYNAPFYLTLSSSSVHDTILYTVDGSLPLPQNTGGKTYIYKPGPESDFMERTLKTFVYDAPINIKDRSEENNQVSTIPNSYIKFAPPLVTLDKSTVVRAAVQKADTTGEVFSRVYFVGNHLQSYLNLPVLSLAVAEDDFWGYEQGIYVPGINYNPANLRFSGNHFQRGDEWERTVHVHYFDTNGDAGFSQLMGIRIHGGTSRIYSNRSLRLYARSDYGNNVLTYPLFENSRNITHKRLKLRTSGQDIKHTFFRDALMTKLMMNRTPIREDYHPVNLFINGEYWGITNIRERFDNHYVEQNLGIDRDRVEILDHWTYTNDNYETFRSYVGEEDPGNDDFFDFINQKINIQSLLDLRIAEVFFGRWDIHWKTWRVPDSDFDKWQWVLWDFDVGMSLPNAWGPEWSHYAPYDANYLKPFLTDYRIETLNYEFSRMMQNQTVRNMFINSFADMLNSNLSKNHILQEIDHFKNLIEPAVPKHVERWLSVEGIPSVDHWYKSIGILKRFAEHRHPHIYEHIKEYFNIDDTIEIKTDVSNQYKGYVKINTLKIHPPTPGISEFPYPFSGTYFQGIPVEVEAIPNPGYRFSHWEGASSSTSATITLDNHEDVFLKAHFEKTNEPVLIHYWLFDTSLPNNTPLEYLHTSYSALPYGKIEFKSCLEGYPYDENHTNWRKASMERRNAPTPLNYRGEGNNHIPYADANLRGLQIRQPFVHHDKENEVILKLPTTGFSDIVLRFAVKDEGAVEQLIMDYSIDEHTDKWVTSGLTNNAFDIFGAYQNYQVDFRSIDGVANNSRFKVRIRFAGENLTDDNRERVTFNNISLDGIALGAHNIYSSAGMKGNIYPSGCIPVYNGSNRAFLIKPDEAYRIKGVYVNGTDETDNLELLEGDSALFVFEDVTESHNFHAKFALHADSIKRPRKNLALYPNPAGDEVTIKAVDHIHMIQIANMTGQVLKAFDNLSANTITLNLSSINSGIYIAIVHTRKGVVSEKLQIIK